MKKQKHIKGIWQNLNIEYIESDIYSLKKYKYEI